jgi:endonuclease-3
MDRPILDGDSVGDALDRLYADPACELRGRDAWELLCAAILAERTHDQQVNKVMAVLTEHITSPTAMARLDHRDLEPALRQLPLYRQKARALVEAARAVVRLHGGRVPASLSDLAALPGVGRATAALALGAAFGVPALVADDHARRIAFRLGWSAGDGGRECERALAERFPPHRWMRLREQLVRFGRELCRRVGPRCERCPFASACPKRGVPEPRAELR